jgi:hypothetical protein
MAKMVLMNGRKAKLIDQKRTFLNTLAYGLFTASTGGVILDTYTLADFTVINGAGGPTDTGYAAITPVFAAATLNGSNQGQLLAPIITYVFTYSGGVPFTILGYVAVDPVGPTLAYAQFGSSSVPIGASGDSYSITPLMLDDTMP